MLSTCVRGQPLHDVIQELFKQPLLKSLSQARTWHPGATRQMVHWWRDSSPNLKQAENF